MRWWGVLWTVVLLESTYVFCSAVPANNNESMKATVSVSILGPEDVALALQKVIITVIRNFGVEAIPVLDPAVCNITDETACITENIRKAANPGNTAPVAIVVVPPDAMPKASHLQDAFIRDLGDLMTPTRRACLASTPAARSLVDLTDPAIAAVYNIPDAIVQSLETNEITICQDGCIPEWCINATCATILTSTEVEAKVLRNEVIKHHLHAVVRQMGEHLSNVTSLSATRPIIACDWAPQLYALADFKGITLGPPPCEASPCPFETRRVVKYINNLKLHRAPSVIKALTKLFITDEGMQKLAVDTKTKGAEQAAREYIKAHPLTIPPHEVSVAVLFPGTTSRETYNTLGLNSAAGAGQVDLRKDWIKMTALTAEFHIQFHDDQCHTKGAFKFLMDAPGTVGYGSLTAVIGSGCGAAWADLAKQAVVFNLAALAYTPQAPASLPPEHIDNRLQLLAAGDARNEASAIAELVKRLEWHRVAALSEPATRPLLDAIRIQATIVVHNEIPENGSNIGLDRIQNWASLAAKENTRILYLCVEDARIARAAMCAGRSAGLTPSAGAVWLLCNTHQHGWLNAKPGENCTTEQLKEVAEGHFSVISDWALAWQTEVKNASESRKQWEELWMVQCQNYNNINKTTDKCSSGPDANAALLYDILRQWGAAVYRVLEKNPLYVDDLHDLHIMRELVEVTKNSEYTGLTGTFKWVPVEGAYARVVTLVLTQWDSTSGARTVGTWTKDSFILNNTALKWYTSDGHVPDDGSESCALQGLADALHTDCRTAFVALCTIIVAILVAIVAAIAFHCRRRAEKEYRKRLQALGMRPLAIKPVGLDRWEVPRERVVINRKLGTGAFGTVYGGHALLVEDRGWTAVAVKTLKAGATTEEKLDFLSEAEAMKRFDHKNVVRLLGVVTKTEPVCTVMEFMLYGDLKNYLLARRHLAMGGGIEESEGLEVDEASPRRLTGMALDVARALSYLAQLRYVHRDVAARNCLVSARRVVKLADFGMTRLVFENDYYRFSRKGMLPVRWMAPESLALGVFSPASDVWSFGVLLYEIVTFSSLPYQGLSNSEVLAKVKGGRTLDLPQGLKPQLEGLIKSCWQQDPKKRPTASEVAAFLADAPRLLTPCLDIPLDALPLDSEPPWRLPRDQAEARWVSWAAPASAATDSTYVSADGAVPLETDNFLT